MNALETGILAKFAATTNLASVSFSNGAYLGEAPANKDFPYLVLRTISAPLQESYGTNGKHADVWVEFAGYFGQSGTNTAKTAGASAFDTLTATYDDFLPTVSGRQCCNVRRMSEPVGEVQDPDTDGSQPWRFTVTYQYSIR